MTLWRTIKKPDQVKIPTLGGPVLTIGTVAVPVSPPDRDQAGLSIIATAVLAYKAGRALPGGLAAVFGVTSELWSDGRPAGGLLVFGPIAGPGVALLAVVSRIDGPPPMGWDALLAAPLPQHRRAVEDLGRSIGARPLAPLAALAAMAQLATSTGLAHGSALQRGRA